MSASAAFAYENLIRLVPDWPQEGVVFRDLSPLLATRFHETIEAMGALFTDEDLAAMDAFAGIDARGFVFASALAARHGKQVLLIRKAGKLPPPVVQQDYALEYGAARLAVAADLPPRRVAVIDDVLATGGTLTAAADLCAAAGHTVTSVAVFLNLAFLNTWTWRDITPRAVIASKN